MAKEERKELEALAIWLRTFPVIYDLAEDKENSEDSAGVAWLNEESLAG